MLAKGEVLYIHCTGGHGRTGTVCALLLASAYNLGAQESIGRVQAYHDTRQTPVFRAPYNRVCSRDSRGTHQEPHRCWSLPEPDDCVALFPIQRQQVQRLVGQGLLNRRHDAADDSGLLEPADDEEKEVEIAWPSTEAVDSMSERGRHACWMEIGKEAMTAASGRDWEAAAKLLRHCIDLRPHWPKSYALLARCLTKLGRRSAAARVCAHGTRICRDSHAADGTTSRHYRVLEDLAITLSSSLPPSSSSGAEVVEDNSKAPDCLSFDNEGQEFYHDANDARETQTYSCPETADTSSGSSSGTLLLTSPHLRKESLPSFVMLVGLPGAGKSTFAEALQRSNPEEWQLLSSDAIGSRSAVEEALSNATRSRKTGKSCSLERYIMARHAELWQVGMFLHVQ